MILYLWILGNDHHDKFNSHPSPQHTVTILFSCGETSRSILLATCRYILQCYLFIATDLFNTQQSPPALLRWLATSTTKSTCKLEFSCSPGPSLSSLVSTRGHSALSAGVSVSFPSGEACGSLSFQTFGPWSAGLRMAGAQSGSHVSGAKWRKSRRSWIQWLVSYHWKCLQESCCFT